MTSACVLYLDNIEINEQKAYVPEVFSALFQETDRHEFPDEENGLINVDYCASRQTILRRLDLMGCTEDFSKQRFEQWRQIEIQDANDSSFCQEEESQALNALTWLEWKKRVPKVLRTQFDHKFADEIDRRMKDNVDRPWLWFDGYDSLLSMRAIIGAATDFEMVKLDIQPLISAGWIAGDKKICEKAIRVVSARGQPTGPTLILAEGKSDIEILRRALGRLHPELADFITFLDHSEFQVDGGASFTVKFLKAFAAARIPSNIVAIFDNDTAGRKAYTQAKTLKLPPNMVCLQLPDIELGRSYPTIGPQGEHLCDINGRACSIELYLGRTALSLNGKLSPVRWTGYDAHAGAYQGEVECKVDVQSAFLKAMRHNSEDSGQDFPEMKLVWEAILEAAVHAAESSQKHARAPRNWC